jgi:hypothetical protein
MNDFFRILGLGKRHTLETVFTPTKAAKLNYIERSELEKQVNRAIKMPGNRMPPGSSPTDNRIVINFALSRAIICYDLSILLPVMGQ